LLAHEEAGDVVVLSVHDNWMFAPSAPLQGFTLEFLQRFLFQLNLAGMILSNVVQTEQYLWGTSGGLMKLELDVENNSLALR